MPTGYTQLLIDNPNATFRDFALRCARAMGMCIMQRDDSLDAPVDLDEQPSAYSQAAADRLRIKQQQVKAMTDEEWWCKQEKEDQQRRERHEQYREDVLRKNQVFRDMHTQVNNWEPPSAELNGLKEFMLSQLTMSMIPVPDQPKPTTLTPREEYLSTLAVEISHYEERQRQENERVAARNNLKRLLVESLDRMEPAQ